MAAKAARKPNLQAARTEQSSADAYEAFMRSHTSEVQTLASPGLLVEALPTGAIALDVALGIGGLPRGRIIEVFGPEHSGKTSVCLSIIGQVHANGGHAAFIDAEHALDPAWAATFGVQGHLAVVQPDSGEHGLNMALEMAQSRAFDVIVIDSVAALVPQAEIDGEMGDMQVGAQARMMSKAMRKLAGIASSSNTTLIFINQLREKIGVIYGSPEVTTGGKALKFYSSVRIDVRSAAGARLKTSDKEPPYGQTLTCKIVKNKVARPYTTCQFNLLYGQGIDISGSLFDAATAVGLLVKKDNGNTYIDASTGEALAVGRGATTARIASDPDLAQRLEAGIRAAIRGELIDPDTEDEEMPAELAAALADEDTPQSAETPVPVSAPDTGYSDNFDAPVALTG